MDKQRYIHRPNLSLFTKLLAFEKARNGFDNELRLFRERTYADIQQFLNSPLTRGENDYTNLLNRLDATCEIIKQLSAVLKGFPSGQNGKSSVNDRSPCECVLTQNLKKNLGTEGSERLQSGRVIQNVPVTVSISKAVQLNGTALHIGQKNALVERTPVMPVVPSQQCRPSVAVVSPHSVTESHKTPKDEMSKDVIPKQSKMADCASMSPNSSKDVASKSITIIERKLLPVQLTQTVTPKHMPVKQTTKVEHPNLIQNFPTHLIDMGLDIHFEIQYQKQTSSQLIAFIKSSGKAHFTTLLTFIRRELDTSERGEAQTYLMKVTSGQMNTGSAAEPKAKVTPTSSPKMEQVRGSPDVRGPVFRVKHVNDGTLIYSCIIATRTELWDISDICTGVSHAFSEAQCITGSGPFFPQQVMDLRSSPDLEMPPASHQGEEEESDGGSSDSEVAWESSRSPSLAIPAFQIRKFEEMTVVVTHVVDPDNFYIQHQDSKVKELSSKMDFNMCNTCLVQMDRVPDIGSYALGWFPQQQQWCRVQVAKICGLKRDAFNSSIGSIKNIEVEVQRIDFGDTARLSLKDLRELSKEVAAYPAQALQVALANVRPVDGKGWTDQAVSWFKDKVSNRTLYARLFPQDIRVTVELFMERGKIGAMRRGASLSLRLAQNGHAKHNQLKNTSLRRNLAQEQSRKEAVAWEKYIISCYAQNKK